MSFFAVLLALVLEQFKPLPRDDRLSEGVDGWMQWVNRNFDAGRPHHPWVVWMLSVVGPALLVGLLHILISSFSVLLAMALDIAVLYLSLGFRSFSHHITGIRGALEAGEMDEARRRLVEWLPLEAADLPRSELVRHVIEHGLLAAHRRVFGVFFCFVALSALGLGPAGAVLYRLADAARVLARREFMPPNAARAFAVIDHVPARLTAFGFAVVGNFEEAINGWRRDAELWAEANVGVILAAAAGAVGVRLGGRERGSAAEAPGTAADAVATTAAAHAVSSTSTGTSAGLLAGAAAASTPGDSARLEHLRSMVALTWRSVVLWMLLLALLTLANLIG